MSSTWGRVEEDNIFQLVTHYLHRHLVSLPILACISSTDAALAAKLQYLRLGVASASNSL